MDECSVSRPGLLITGRSPVKVREIVLTRHLLNSADTRSAGVIFSLWPSQPFQGTVATVPTTYLSARDAALHHPDPHHTPSQDDMLERHVAPSPSCYADEGCVINVSILPSKPEEGPSAAFPVKQHAIESTSLLHDSSLFPMAFSVIRERSRPFPTAYLSAGVEALHHPDPHHTPSQDDISKEHAILFPSYFADEGFEKNANTRHGRQQRVTKRAGLPAMVPVRVGSPIAIILSGRNDCETRALHVVVQHTLRIRYPIAVQQYDPSSMMYFFQMIPDKPCLPTLKRTWYTDHQKTTNFWQNCR